MNKKEIEKVLRDYRWMINEIKRQRELMGIKSDSFVAHIDDMPKGKGTTSDPVAREVIRRDKASRWVQQLEKKVLFVQGRIPVIKDEREKAVLHCLLDGMSMLSISKHMGLSERHIRRLKDGIVTKMSDMSNMPNKSNSCA